MNLINAEIKVPQSVLFCVLIVASLRYEYILGTFTAICLALAWLCLLFVFSLMPFLLKNKYIKIENEHPFIYYMIVWEKKKKAFDVYQTSVKIVIAIAATLVVLGAIGYVIAH